MNYGPDRKFYRKMALLWLLVPSVTVVMYLFPDWRDAILIALGAAVFLCPLGFLIYVGWIKKPPQ